MAMAGGGGGRRTAWAESRHRLVLRGRARPARAGPQAGLARAAADCGRPCCIGGAGGRCGGAGHEHGPDHALDAGGRGPGAGVGAGTGGIDQVRHIGCIGCIGYIGHANRPASPASHTNSTGPTGASCAGAVVLRHVHRARRRLDAGAGAHPDLPQHRPCWADHRIRLARAGASRRGHPHRGDARSHRNYRFYNMQQVCAIITARSAPCLWYRSAPITFMVAQT